MDRQHPEGQTATTISYDVWAGTVVPSTHIAKNHFDAKVYICEFIMQILNYTNKINTI